MEWRHTDLRGNYVRSLSSKCGDEHLKWVTILFPQDSSASHDFIHYDSDPTPDFNSEEPNSHGTECAGIVGMTKNSICGIGVAHHANIGCKLVY